MSPPRACITLSFPRKKRTPRRVQPGIKPMGRHGFSLMRWTKSRHLLRMDASGTTYLRISHRARLITLSIANLEPLSATSAGLLEQSEVSVRRIGAGFHDHYRYLPRSHQAHVRGPIWRDASGRIDPAMQVHRVKKSGEVRVLGDPKTVWVECHWRGRRPAPARSPRHLNGPRERLAKRRLVWVYRLTLGSSA
jgi:hypothetical protein